MALVMRIKFPPTYPLIYKTLRIDSKLTTAEAIQFISETLNVAVQGNVGLYIPQERLWLDQNTPLSQYDQLQEVEEVEFRDRDAPPDVPKVGTGTGKSGGCCTLFWGGLPSYIRKGLVWFSLGIIIIRLSLSSFPRFFSSSPSTPLFFFPFASSLLQLFIFLFWPKRVFVWWVLFDAGNNDSTARYTSGEMKA